MYHRINISHTHLWDLRNELYRKWCWKIPCFGIGKTPWKNERMNTSNGWAFLQKSISGLNNGVILAMDIYIYIYVSRSGLSMVCWVYFMRKRR